MQRDLALVKPTRKYASQVMHYKQEMLANNDSLDGCAGLEDTDSFDEWIDFDNRLKKKYGEGYVPSEVFLAIRKADDKLVGIIDFRRPLSPFLLQYGGNIGYSILPSNVKKGMPKRCSPYSCPSVKSRASNVFYLPVTRAMKHQDGRLSAMVERWRMKS